jgi:hypothetical protein
MKKITALLVALNCLFALPGLAEPTANAAKAQAEVLNNAAVIELKQLALGEGVIVEKIKTSQCDFDTSVNALKQLKAAEISDVVIAAMLSAKSGGGNYSASPALITDPNDPKAPHEPGIWLYEEDASKPKMTELEPSVYGQSKLGTSIFIAWGGTMKQQAVIRNPHAELTMTNRQPVFYFYFERTQAGLSDNHGATSPNEYTLAQFEVGQKDDAQERRLVMGSINAFAGSTVGPESKSVRAFDYQRISPGIYKVSPKADLKDGEYGYFYGGTTHDAGGGKVFDFGIKGSNEEPEPSAAQASAPAKKTNPVKKFLHIGGSSNNTIVAHEAAK